MTNVLQISFAQSYCGGKKKIFVRVISRKGYAATTRLVYCFALSSSARLFGSRPACVFHLFLDTPQTHTHMLQKAFYQAEKDV